MNLKTMSFNFENQTLGEINLALILRKLFGGMWRFVLSFLKHQTNNLRGSGRK